MITYHSSTAATNSSIRTEKAIRASAGKCRASGLLSPTAIVFGTASTAVIAAALFALAGFGSIRAVVGYYFRSETLIVDATEKSFGVTFPLEKAGVSFKFTNRGEEPIRILGCKTRCACTVARDLPFTLKPNESKQLNLTVQPPPFEQGAVAQIDYLELPITVFTSSRTQSRINVIIRGEVRVRPVAVE